MKLTLLIFVGLIAVSLAKKSCDEGQQPIPIPAPAPAPSVLNDKEVKKWSIKELFSSDMTKKKQIVKMIKVLKLAGFVGVPALKALVDAKLKNIEKDSWDKNLGNMGKDSWHTNIGKDSWNNYEYAVGYDVYGNPSYWPVQKKTGLKSSFGIKSLFADKLSIPLALKHKLTKGKF